MSEHFTPLLKQAKASAALAYAPYSQFQVGAALITHTGKVIGGCNVENASYGLAICAERNAITSAVTAGFKPGDIKELLIYIDREELFSPCGACRQVISEFMTADSTVTACNKTGESMSWTVAGLLPDGFRMPE